MNGKKFLKSPFLYSLAAHGVLAVLLFFFSGPAKLTHERINEVELIDASALFARVQQDPSLLNQGQIVEQDENPLNDEIPKDAKYLSRHNQKVVREEQAATHGKFRNTADSAGARSSEQKPGKTSDQKSADKTAKEDQPNKEIKQPNDDKNFYASDDGPTTKSKPSLKDLTPSFKPGPPPIDDAQVAQGGGEGPSASDDHLKDVKQGMQTLLSTREFVYYTYYNRIKDKLRQYWEPKIKEKMTRILRQGRTIASSNDRVTRVVIVLDNRGTLVRVQIVGASGVADLDDAAVEAFRAAAPFPNPPKGIVDPDGTIKIRWDFILEA